MIEKKSGTKLLLIFILCGLALIVQFILPSNPFISKPSTVIMAFIELFQSYSLITNVLITLSTMYAALFIVYFGGKLFLYFYSRIKKLEVNEKIITLLAGSMPSIIIGFLLLIWFPHFSLLSFVFILVVAAIQMKSDLIKASHKIPQEYFDSLISITRNEKVVRNQLFSKGLRPSILKSIINNHKYLWTLLIVFEFINGQHGGLGSLIKLSLEYWNVAFMYALLLMILIFVFIGEALLNYLYTRLFNWEIN